MIFTRSTQDGIKIYGHNRMDSAWSFVILGVAFVLAIAVVWISTHSLAVLFTTLLTFIGIVIIRRHVTTFSILLTTNHVTIKKYLFGISYLSIHIPFEKVLYNPPVSCLYFENYSDALSIEDHVGFEIDCLLITQESRWIEIGDATDSPVIFKHLLAGMDQLKIKRETAGIGEAKPISPFK